MLRVDNETTEPLDDKFAAEVKRRFGQALSESDIVVLSDYAKGVLGDRLLRGVVALSRRARRPVIADPKRPAFRAYRNVTVLTPNAHEVTRATGIDAGDDEGAERAGRAALDAAGCDAVIVTRSESGLTLVRRDMPALHLPARVREVSDVSGAGDTFVAALAATLACDIDLAKATRLANIAAGISVARPGTAVVSGRDLTEELRRRNVTASDEKIMSAETVLQRIAEWRRDGLRIGFTNGCFDLIHPGHVHLLTEARARCDRLVVALNTDASARRLGKGADRPLNQEQDRAIVMAALESVSLVTWFDEDTPLELIQELRPGVLVKGGDYDMDQLAEARFVRGYGGRALAIPFVQGYSTTRLVNRIRANG